MEIAGTGIYDINVRFRMYVVVIFGIFALGSVLYWRAQLFLATEPVDLPVHKVRVVEAE